MGKELTPVQRATMRLLDFYKHLLADHAEVPDAYAALPTLNRAYLAQMIDAALVNVAHWPIDKASRWLGFIQAGVVLHGISDVEKERAYSRHLFHAAYLADGLQPPASVSVHSYKS